MAAEPSNGGLKCSNSAKRNGEYADLARTADISTVNGSHARVSSDIQPTAATASVDTAGVAETSMLQQSDDLALPSQPTGEAVLPPQGLASLQASRSHLSGSLRAAPLPRATWYDN